MPKLQPVLLSGGSGTRLWPLSREAYPKQFLPLAGDDTMLQATWLRVAALLVLIAAAVGLFFTSEPGKQLIAFGRDSVREVKKVVWPTRKEAGQMTGYVFAFVLVMALFMWLTDKTLEWVLYDLVLGWRR